VVINNTGLTLSTLFRQRAALNKAQIPLCRLSREWRPRQTRDIPVDLSVTSPISQFLVDKLTGLLLPTCHGNFSNHRHMSRNPETSPWYVSRESFGEVCAVEFGLKKAGRNLAFYILIAGDAGDPDHSDRVSQIEASRHSANPGIRDLTAT